MGTGSAVPATGKAKKAKDKGDEPDTGGMEPAAAGMSPARPAAPLESGLLNLRAALSAALLLSEAGRTNVRYAPVTCPRPRSDGHSVSAEAVCLCEAETPCIDIVSEDTGLSVKPDNDVVGGHAVVESTWRWRLWASGHSVCRLVFGQGTACRRNSICDLWAFSTALSGESGLLPAGRWSWGRRDRLYPARGDRGHARRGAARDLLGLGADGFLGGLNRRGSRAPHASARRRSRALPWTGPASWASSM